MRGVLSRCHEQHWPFIEALLHELVEEVHEPGSPLATMCSYHLDTGGKRLRALLPVLVFEACGQSPEQAYPLAAACEMLHNATLVHDDLQDGDVLRRDRETVWRRWGMPQAINLGDAMFFYPILLLDGLSCPQRLRLQLVALLARETLRVIDGQAREFELQDARSPDFGDYLEMVERKTSALFTLPMVGAALLAELSPELCETLAEAGRQLGILFQLQDDLLDLFGDKGRGRRGADIEEGKLSALVVHLIERGPPGKALELRELLGRPREQIGADEIGWAADLFVEHGSLDFCLEEIARRRKAMDGLEALEAMPGLMEVVLDFTDAALEPARGLIGG